MLLFDWTKIYNEANGSPSGIVRIFRMLVNREVPRNRKDPIFKAYQKDYSGRSFLLNGDVLLYNRYMYTNHQVAEYLGLAALRSSADYYAYGKITLPLIHCPVTEHEVVRNPLLFIIDDEVHFIYEDKENLSHH